MGKRNLASTQRRLKNATTRIEQQEYNFVTPRRSPRLNVAGGYGYCQLSATLNAATGTWPNLTPTKTNTNSVSIYRATLTNGNAALVEITNAATVYNWRNVTWSASKTSYCVPNNIGGWDIIDQDC